MPKLSSAPTLIKCHGRSFFAANVFGVHARDFINKTKERYETGVLCPPLSERHVDMIYQLLLPLNQDLCPDLNCNTEDQIRTKSWENAWKNIIAEYKQEGRILTGKEIEQAKQDVFSAYRHKIIQLSTFSPYGHQTLEIDEIHIQEYLICISNCMSHYSSKEAYTHLHHHFMHEFKNHFWLDLQMLSRYLHINQRSAYLKKFEEILSRKSIKFLGDEPITHLFKAITKDREFLKKLPLFIEESPILRDFLINYPDKRQRDEVLTTAMYELLDQGIDLFSIQSMMKKTMMN